MIPLSIIVDPLGGWLALIFILVFVIKAVMAAFGFDSGGTDVDVDGDFDVDSDGLGMSMSDVFSLKGFLNFGVGFTACWALFGLKGWYAVLAVAVGVLTLFLLLWTYRACMKLEGNTVVEKPTELLHRRGTVYTVSESNLVIQIPINGRIEELTVLPAKDVEMTDFYVGCTVYISDIVTENDVTTWFVRPYITNNV